MLWIHKEADGKVRMVLRLEGSLLSPWAPELVGVLESMATEALAIDLASLAYADKQGERLQRDLGARARVARVLALSREAAAREAEAMNPAIAADQTEPRTRDDARLVADLLAGDEEA